MNPNHIKKTIIEDIVELCNAYESIFSTKIEANGGRIVGLIDENEVDEEDKKNKKDIYLF